MFNRKLVNFDADVASKPHFLASTGMASRNIEGRYGQPKYCYEKAINVMISFALDFFFWIDGFQFSFTYGAPLRALRGRGRSAKKKEIRQV